MSPGGTIMRCKQVHEMVLYTLISPAVRAGGREHVFAKCFHDTYRPTDPGLTTVLQHCLSPRPRASIEAAKVPGIESA